MADEAVTFHDLTTNAQTVSTLSARLRTADGIIGYCAVCDDQPLTSAGPWFASFTFPIADYGSGYTVGDVLSIPGGVLWPGSIPISFVILSLGAGGSIHEIDFVGASFVPEYQAPPSNPFTITNSTSGSATVTINWTQLWTNGPYVPTGSITVNTSNTNFRVNDTCIMSPHHGTEWLLWPRLQIHVDSITVGTPPFGSILTCSINTIFNSNTWPYWITLPAAPGDTINLTGGSGTGATITIAPETNLTFQLGQGIPRLAQWNLQTGERTHETADHPFSANDQMFGLMAVRPSDNHLFTWNGDGILYHIAPGLALVGSVSAQSTYRSFLRTPMAGWAATWARSGTFFNFGTPGGDMAVGESRLYAIQNVDFRGTVYGIDVFDISADDPVYLRSINFPAYPLFPVQANVSGMAVDASTDTLYVLAATGTDVAGYANHTLHLLKVGPSDTIATDITPASWASGYDFQMFNGAGLSWCVFCIDQDNQILLFGGATDQSAVPMTYRVTAYDLPALTERWHIDPFNLDDTDGVFGCVANNIINGVWRAFVWDTVTSAPDSSGFDGGAVLTDYDILTGAIVSTIDAVDITNFYGDGSGNGVNSFRDQYLCQESGVKAAD